jgi:hypothetical protein
LTAAHRARLDAAAAAHGGRGQAEAQAAQATEATEATQATQRCLPNDELCLVQSHPAPEKVRAEVLAEAFVPAQPPRWSTHPSEWLMNDDIDSVLHQYAAACPRFHYTGFGFMDFAADERAPVAPRGYPFEPVGGDVANKRSSRSSRAKRLQQPDAQTAEQCVSRSVCSLDIGKLAKRGVTLAAAVLNLSRHVEKGTHWVFVVLFLPPAPSGRAEMVYFDSNAEETPNEVKRWHIRLQAQWSAARGDGASLRLRSNSLARQRTNSECGMWCLVCIVSLVLGRWLTAADAADNGAALEAAPCAVDPVSTVPRMLDELLDVSLPMTDAIAANFRSAFFHNRREHGSID